MPRKMKMKISVDFDELYEAFEFGSVDRRHFLELETGEIIFVSDGSMSIEEVEAIEKKVAKELGGRYVEIPYVSSNEGYEDMLDFADTVEDLGSEKSSMLP